MVNRDAKEVKKNTKPDSGNAKTYQCSQYDFECDDRLADLEKASVGKTVEEQMDCFFVEESVTLSKTAYGDSIKEQTSGKTIKLSEYEGVTELLLKGDTLVGAVVDGIFGKEKLFPGQSVCTYCASDNEGIGCNEREDYIKLIYAEQTCKK